MWKEKKACLHSCAWPCFPALSFRITLMAGGGPGRGPGQMAFLLGLWGVEGALTDSRGLDVN